MDVRLIARLITVPNAALAQRTARAWTCVYNVHARARTLIKLCVVIEHVDFCDCTHGSQMHAAIGRIIRSIIGDATVSRPSVRLSVRDV